MERFVERAHAGAELPLLDPAAMRDWTEDLDKEDVLALLRRVPQECDKCLGDICMAIERGDLAGARRSAHRLKGMAGNLGAARLAWMARTIELASQSLDDVSARLPALETTARQTLDAIADYR